MAFTKAQLDAYIQGLYDDDGQLSSADNQLIINYILSNGNPEIDPRDLIQIRRGDEADLPTLAQGEMALTLDEEKVYIGGLNGNIKVNKDDLIINVKEFGAKGDGLADDTAAIQNAIDFLEITGGIVFIPKGEYIITNTILLKSGVSIYGEGWRYTALQGTATTIKKTTNGDAFSTGIDPAVTSPFISALTLSNFLLLADDSMTSGNGILASSLRYQVLFERLSVVNFPDDGIQCSNCWEIKFRNVFSRGNRNNLRLLNGNNQVVYEKGMLSSATENAIKLDATTVTNQVIVIDSCLLESNANAIMAEAVQILDLKNNYFEGNGARAIYAPEITTAFNAETILSSGNRFHNNGSSDIQINNPLTKFTSIADFFSKTTASVTPRINVSSSSNKNCTVINPDTTNILAGNPIYGRKANILIINPSEIQMVSRTRDAQEVGAGSINFNTAGPYTNGALEFYDGNEFRTFEIFARKSAIPTTGTWKLGDRVINSNPTPGGYIGWVCTTAGTPGTWKGYGLIQA